MNSNKLPPDCQSELDCHEQETRSTTLWADLSIRVEVKAIVILTKEESVAAAVSPATKTPLRRSGACLITPQPARPPAKQSWFWRGP